MKILIVTNKDGPSLFIENIVRELAAQGNELVIYTTSNDENSIRMFLNLDIPIHPFNELNEKIAKPFDFFFMPASGVTWKTALYNKYIFSFSNMNTVFEHIRGADFVFTQNLISETYEKTFAYMPMGNPKNDSMSSEFISMPSGKKINRRILFIDSGHFPFSVTGKRQVAEMILKICRHFPEYEICVKPRWLPGTDTRSMTHVNRWHLYDFIEQLCAGEMIPENLNLLREHLDLQELIDSSYSVVTMCTTAYLDAALRGKGLVIVGGFDNEDMFQVRQGHFEQFYIYASRSGCVVDYHDVCRFLPDGLQCRPRHLKETYAFMGGVSKRVVSVMQYVYERFLSRGTCPDIAEYSHLDYQSSMKAMPEFSWNKLKRYRYCCLAEGLIAQNKSISRNMDWTDFMNFQKELCMNVSLDTQKLADFKNTLLTAKYEYLVSHAHDLWSNDVDRSFYFSALYYTGRKNELLSMPHADQNKHTVLCYYCGLILHERGDFLAAIEYLESYLCGALTRAYFKYREESAMFKRTGMLALMDCYYHLRDWQSLLRILSSYLIDPCSATKNKTVAEQVQTYRAAVRTHCGEQLAALDTIKT